MADAGETIELALTLKNGGAQDATGVDAVLTADDSLNVLTITQGTVTYGTLMPGETSVGSGVFEITIDPSAPVAYQPILRVTATGNEGSWEDPIALPLRRPYLEHYAHEFDDQAPRGNGNGVVEAGEEILYRVTLRNTGQDRATAVSGTLRALEVATQGPHPLVTVGDSLSSFGTMAPGAEVQGDSFAFTLDGGADPSTLLLELTLSDDLGLADIALLDALLPVAPENINAFGSPTSIRLEWNPSVSADVKGYDIWRSSSMGGPFDRINAYTVDGSAAYEDLHLAPLTRYYYQVVARDSSYNASVPSEVISGTTNPPAATGWPQPVEQQSASSPIAADIDGGPHNEILFGAEVQYAFHGDGSEVVDGDDDPRTNGPFSLHGRDEVKGFSATPAAGNLDGLGDSLQVVNVSHARDSLFVWDNQGQLMPGWPKRVLRDTNWGSPLLADLDIDGDLEVVVWAANGMRLFAWHHDGVEIIDGDQNPATDGVLVQLSGNWSFNYSSPAVGNLDQDPELEIVFAVNFSDDNNGAIHAYNIDATPVPGWPFFGAEPGHTSQVTASPVIADLDDDGHEEIIIAAERDFDPLNGRLYVLSDSATVVPGWPRAIPSYTPDARVPSASIADLDGDGSLDIIYPDTEGQLRAYSRFGTTLSGFPVTYFENPPSQATQSTASIGDIDDDGRLEIVFGDTSGKVHAYNHDGTLAAGFPIQLAGEVHGTPALWDIDLDFHLEVVALSFDTNVYAWDVPGSFNLLRLPWPFFRHDPMNTGRFATVIPAGPTGVEDPGAAGALGLTAAAFHPARPNPFNPHTTLAFDVPGEARGARRVTLGIYDVSGRLIRRLVDGQVETGRHEIRWDGRGSDGRLRSSGVYFARIEIGGFVSTQKLTMVR
jgi:hypothetical protein